MTTELSPQDATLRERRAQIEAGGATKYHESNAKKGKLFVRERLTRLLHYNLVDTAPGHACSYDFVPWYVTCNYMPILTARRGYFKY